MRSQKHEELMKMVSRIEIPTLKEVRDKYIRGVLVVCGGNRTYAAKKLGISVRGLRMILRRERRSGRV